MTGTNYVKSKYPEVKSAVEVTLGKQWDKVYKTTMYIPNKAIQITGEVYISAQEIIFAYGQVCVNPANIYWFNINNRNRKRCGICSKITIKNIRTTSTTLFCCFSC